MPHCSLCIGWALNARKAESNSVNSAVLVGWQIGGVPMSPNVVRNGSAV